MIKALQLRFLLLEQFFKLAIMALTRATANNIGRNTIHTALNINKNSKGSNKIQRPWPQQLALIINKINMLDLKMFATIDQQLLRAKGLPRNSKAIFKGLA